VLNIAINNFIRHQSAKLACTFNVAVMFKYSTIYRPIIDNLISILTDVK